MEDERYLWQSADELVLHTVFERLLVMDEGKRWVSLTEELWELLRLAHLPPAQSPAARRRPRSLSPDGWLLLALGRLPPSHPPARLLSTPCVPPVQVRVASHVCSSWRSAAQALLLADTAISKPPLEE